MIKLWGSNNKSVLGIDISSACVKLLELSFKSNKPLVKNYAIEAFADNIIEGNEIKDSQALGLFIKHIIRNKGFTAKDVVLSVPDSTAFSKVIQISDGLTEQELEELVVIEADKHIPFPIDEINFDFEILGKSTKNPALNDVLLVASRSDNVGSRVETIINSGLNPTVVDVESYAIERAAQLLAPILPAQGVDKNIAIIDIGASYTHFFVLHNMKIVFAKEEDFGGKILIDAIVQKYKLSRIDAQLGLQQSTLPKEFAKEVLEPFREKILLQIKRSIQVFFSSTQYTFLDYVFIAGGIARIEGIDKLIEEHINIPVKIVDLFQDMDFANNINHDVFIHDAPALMLACGLALRGKDLQ